MLVLIIFPSNYNTQGQVCICAFQNQVLTIFLFDSFSEILWLNLDWDRSDQVLDFLDLQLQEINF